MRDGAHSIRYPVRVSESYRGHEVIPAQGDEVGFCILPPASNVQTNGSPTNGSLTTNVSSTNYSLTNGAPSNSSSVNDSPTMW
jgi:hypothetical protein